MQENNSSKKMMVARYLNVALASMIIYFVFCYLIGHVITPPEDNDLRQEDQDWEDLKMFDPFKDLSKIKAIAQRKYHSRISILQRTCRNIHGKQQQHFRIWSQHCTSICRSKCSQQSYSSTWKMAELHLVQF